MNENFEFMRKKMVEYQIEARGIHDKTVVDILGKLPRHLFVPQSQAAYAYEDYPLPINDGQTISQPYIVAIMTELLGLKTTSRVLEIGTGSGYQTAVLASIAKEVYTVERMESLHRKAKHILHDLGYHNVHFYMKNGYEGLEEHAPYDAILVTAATEIVPPNYIKQVVPGGKIVIPIGGSLTQKLKVYTVKSDNKVEEKSIIDVRFVPLIKEDD